MKTLQQIHDSLDTKCTFYTPLQTKCYMLQKQRQKTTVCFGSGDNAADDYKKPVSRVGASFAPLDGPNAGGESVAVRGGDMWVLAPDIFSQ